MPGRRYRAASAKCVFHGGSDANLIPSRDTAGAEAFAVAVTGEEKQPSESRSGGRKWRASIECLRIRSLNVCSAAEVRRGRGNAGVFNAARDWLRRMDALAIDGDAICGWIDSDAQLGDRASVDRYPALADEVLTGTARSESAKGEPSLEAHGLARRPITGI
jgi:hypothetical protein